MEDNNKPQIMTDVKQCARCGQDHNSLVFLRFKGQPLESDGYTFEYWSLCPQLIEPLILSATRMEELGIDDNGQ